VPQSPAPSSPSSRTTRRRSSGCIVSVSIMIFSPPRRDPLARAPDPHLEVIAPVAPATVESGIRSQRVTHGDGNLSRQDRSVAQRR
jgi:hypothetical protein